MLKSSFAKYLVAFVLIIFVSFLMLSGIITSMIHTRSLSDKEYKLDISCSIISDYFENKGVEQLENHIKSGSASSVITLIPLVKADYDFNIVVTDASGNVLLTTIKTDENGLPLIWGELGVVDTQVFRRETHEDGEDYLVYKGILDGITEDESLVRGSAVMTGGPLRGFVFSIASTAREDMLISNTRKIVFNASIWVMLAAVIAAFFITEKLVHPLQSMTKAAKRFAKGDFTERVTVVGNDEVAELAQAFNNMAESLDSLEKMRNSFLASVSHDLRTPMTTISGFIDGITSGAIPEDQQKHYLTVIQSEVHRLSRLVSQLLDLSRLDSGDRKFNFAPFDIAEIARLIVISFEKKLEEKQLDVRFETDEDSVMAIGDKDAIHQVLYNLCHNAIKFSKNGGIFEIKITQTLDKKIRVSVFDEGEMLSEEDMAHIFDRFYKSDKSRGLDKTGVGLGLYICKTIVDAHDEEITVTNRDGGVEFAFTMKANR